MEGLTIAAEAASMASIVLSGSAGSVALIGSVASVASVASMFAVVSLISALLEVTAASVAAVAAVAAAALLLVYALFIWPTQWLKVERVRHSLGIGVKAVQVSDLHVDMIRVSPRKLLAAIRKEAPDYIFLTGDFTYREKYLPKLNTYLAALASTGASIYAVPGNHDHELPRFSHLTRLMRQHNIALLRNRSVELPKLRLVGIDNFSTGHSRPRKAFHRVSVGDKPVIVITHDPNVVDAIETPYDFLLAGHLHGKQLNIPFFFSFKPKGQLPKRGIYKGLHRGQSGPFYISKGIGQAGVNARFMVRSEITVHEW